MALLLFLLLVLWFFKWTRRTRPIEDGPVRDALTKVGWGFIALIGLIVLVEQIT